MLVLTRKSHESIKLGEDITITIVELKGNSVRIGIEAPAHMRIYRKELYEKIRSENILSAGLVMDDVNRISEALRKK